jgi:hypothetical protein
MKAKHRKRLLNYFIISHEVVYRFYLPSKTKKLKCCCVGACIGGSLQLKVKMEIKMFCFFNIKNRQLLII